MHSRMHRGPQRHEIQRVHYPDLQLSVSDLVPSPTPRNISFCSLYLLGLAFMFLIPALVPATENSMDYFDDKMMEAEKIDLTDASNEHRNAKYAYESTRGWFWQSPTSRNIAAERNLKTAERKLNGLLNERARIQSDAKHSVGVWSEYGLEEVRHSFWEYFNSGLGVAKAATKNQAFYSLIFGLGMHRDETLVSFVMRWVVRFMTNLTIGVMGACLGFIMNLYSIVNTYAPSFFSALAFFLLGSLGAISVTLTVVGGLWGTAAGGVYFAAKTAINAAKLENARRQEFIRNGGIPPRQQRSSYTGRRPHYE